MCALLYTMHVPPELAWITDPLVAETLAAANGTTSQVDSMCQGNTEYDKAAALQAAILGGR
jgi:hypothetical protein